MTRLMTFTALAALFATGAAAQVESGGAMQLSPDACSKPHYINMDACKNLDEGRSSSTVSDPQGGTVGNSDAPGSDNLGAGESGAGGGLGGDAGGGGDNGGPGGGGGLD